MRLHHVAGGDGPTVVLLGSLGTTLAMWEPQLPALRGRVVRIDLPGHGGSPVPDRPVSIGDVGRAVLELVGGPASYCGLSLGGVVAMWIAAHAPVEKLVLACTKPVFAPVEQWTQRAALVRREGMGAVADAVAARWFAGEPPARYREMLLGCDPEGYARCCDALRDADLHDDLRRIEAPTLVIAGGVDPTVSVDEARALPGRLVVLERAAHLANADDPAGFNAALAEHLAA